jgi:phosphoglucomutase
MSLEQTLGGMILSASGWRGVFAADGNEESPQSAISADHGVIAAAAATVFAEYLAETGGGTPEVLVARDTRPTGGAVAERMIRSFIAAGATVHYADICAAPEIMARARNFAENRKSAGFVYISASHNPRGHNGLKFGRTDGGVLPGPETAKLAARLKALLADPERVARLSAGASGADNGEGEVERVFAAREAEKKRAREDYYRFALEVAGGPDSAIVRAVRAGIARKPLGIAADLNGSARTVSIDREFITGLGARYRAVNAEPGAIVHRIVPEGESLEPCREFLETLHREDPAFVLGYVPDCDGDRGNLVIWDDALGGARTLEAQEVFALACVSELAHLVWTGELSYDEAGRARQKVAVAVNDPTSLRIDAIARAFGAEIFRAEVGEANVVSRARELREQGYIVRILGEGSAGGNITHPSAVRDPVNTVMALLKLLAVRGGASGDASERGDGSFRGDGSEGDDDSNTIFDDGDSGAGGGSKFTGMGVFALWCARSGQQEKYRPDFTLAGIIAALPSFISTGTYTADALLTVQTADHALLKERYQAVFLREWEARRGRLAEQYGIVDWEAAAYRGTGELRPITRFGDAGTGGLRILFKDTAGAEIAAIWMRGSGTEPVFRVMADAPGTDPRMERELIEWQRRMVMAADKA